MSCRTIWSGSTLLAALGLAAAGEQPAAPADELSEVIVQAPQPRYVAPTQRDRIGRVWVPVFIDDKGPFRLVLDSGATHSAVVPRVVEALQIPTDQSPPVLLRGVTGVAIVPTIRVDSLSVGDLYVGPATLPIVADAFGGADGLLGTEGMQDKRIYIDFRNDFINISRSADLRAARGFTTVPFVAHKLPLMIVQAMMDGLPVQAIIDTGAETSVGNNALKQRLEYRLRHSKLTLDQITGATGDVQEGEGAPVPSIEISGITIRNAHFTFGDMHIFSRWGVQDEPALLIGMDILGLLDTLVIDYKRQELHLKPRR
ncbi:MAG: retroviral-like aspartic protease family protein [Steroidobacteraceae bacterium]